MIRPPQRKSAGVTAAAMLAVMGLALAETAPPPQQAGAKPQEASIPFANHGGIRDWRADGDRGMWVQDAHKRWYYGRFMAPCIGLQFVDTVRFRTGPGDRLDRWSSVRGRDTGNCTFASFVRSDGPPKKADKKPQAGTAAPAAPAAPTTPPAPRS